MVSSLARNARDVGSIPALGEIFSIFITPTAVLCFGGRGMVHKFGDTIKKNHYCKALPILI